MAIQKGTTSNRKPGLKYSPPMCWMLVGSWNVQVLKIKKNLIQWWSLIKVHFTRSLGRLKGLFWLEIDSKKWLKRRKNTGINVKTVELIGTWSWDGGERGMKKKRRSTAAGLERRLRRVPLPRPARKRESGETKRGKDASRLMKAERNAKKEEAVSST